MIRSEDLGAGLPDRCDAVIVGAGASGLSLAAALAGAGWRDRNVLIIDDESHRLEGRAWAYWSKSHEAPGTAASESFDSFRVRGARGDQVVGLREHEYRVVRGHDVNLAVNTALADAPGFTRVQAHVSAIRDGSPQASVIIGGQTVRADWVFDSVGLADSSPAAVRASNRSDTSAMTLAFTGRRIETAMDTFDPGVPTLMDFRTAQGPDLAFVYVLPTSKRVALVEHTRFTDTDDGDHTDGELALTAYLRDIARVGAYRVLSAEHGSVALTTRRPRRSGGRVVPIGIAAGMIKPSTGYGYARIQRHSADLARSLAQYGDPFHVTGLSRRHRALDQVLLTAIRHEPTRVVDAFERLFTANPGDRVLAFLDERTTIGQELAIILTLPPGPFLRAIRTLARERLTLLAQRQNELIKSPSKTSNIPNKEVKEVSA